MEKEIAMKYNRRIFPIYKGLAWQPLFYNAVIFLFLTQVKGITPSKVMYAESIYAFLLIILQVPSTIITEKIGSKKAVVLGTLFGTIQIAMMIFINNFFFLIAAYFMSAFGNALKYISRNTLLYESTKHCKTKNSFGNINAKGASLYYILSSISAFITGFLYVASPYLPLIISCFISVLATIIALRFEDVENNHNKKTTVSETIKDLKQGFSFILKSTRLRALLLFVMIFAGTVLITYRYEECLLTELNIPAQYFGIVFGILTFIQGVSVMFQDKIHKRYKNKSLTFISIPFFLCFVLIGTVVSAKLNVIFTIAMVLLLFVLLYCLKGPYWILEDRYVTNFTNSKNRAKVLSTNNMIENIGYMIVSFLGGLLLEFYSASKAYIIYGVVGLIVIYLVLIYMKKRIGLKPEEYDIEDLQYEE